MTGFKSPGIIALHFLALVAAISIAILSGQNPRIIIYAIGIGLFWRFLTVWILAKLVNHSPELVSLASRKPLLHEKSRPYRHPKTREKAGGFGYLMGILTMMFMIGILQLMVHGENYFQSKSIIPEMLWGLTISFLYWLEDLFTKEIVIHPDKCVEDNLGFNISGYNFLLATIFISNFIFIGMMFAYVLMISVGLMDERRQGFIPIEWIMISVLALLKFAFEIRIPKKARRLPG